MSRRGDGRPRNDIAVLMLLPFFMGGLSLLMWFSIPTFDAILERYDAEIGARQRQLAGIAAGLPRDGRAAASGCTGPLDPLPVRRGDDEAASNTEIISAGRLDDLEITAPLRSDAELYLGGRLGLLMYWRLHPPIGTQRLGRDRVAAEVLDPLATRYLVLYGTERESARALRVDAFLHDAESGARLCELRVLIPVGDESGYSARDPFLAELGRVTGGTFSAARP